MRVNEQNGPEEKGGLVPQSQTQQRIFVVDDEHVIASTLAAILCHEGFAATPYTMPKEALQAARAEAPDLLISDVVMPELSGIDLAIEVRNACPECRVLLFSGQGATMDLLEAARSAGHAFDLLTKPVHPLDLLKKIKSLMN